MDENHILKAIALIGAFLIGMCTCGGYVAYNNWLYNEHSTSVFWIGGALLLALFTFMWAMRNYWHIDI